MSFGVVQSMIITLRNNSRKKALPHFDRGRMPLKGSKGSFDKLLKRKATPEQLEEIRHRIKTERKRKSIKIILFMILILLVLFIGIKIVF